MCIHFEEYVTDHVHPMTALRTSLSYIAHFDPDAENESDENRYERAMRIQAKSSIISYSVCSSKTR